MKLFAPQKSESHKPDIFDAINLDVFDTLDDKRLRDYVAPPKVTLNLSEEIRQLIIQVVKEVVAEQVRGIKPRTVETRTVERIVEKTIPTPEKIIEKQVLDDAKLQKTIDEKIKKVADESLFVPAPPIIPNWSDKPDGVLLSKKGSQLKWVPASAGTGGTSSDSYSPSNVTTTTNYDANNTSLDELADVLGSLIVSLQGAGIIQ